MLKTLLAATALFVLATPMTSAPLAARTAQHTPPRLVVVLVIDQMRADYIPTYGHQWTRGLRRLVDTGASFPLAEYPYALTVTCAGHATVGTGALPSTHGMVGNGWHDRSLRKNVTCTEDASATSVPFGGRDGNERHSTRYLRTTTFADELRLQGTRTPTVVALSLKPRSAITLAGHAGPNTHVVWTEGDGTWATSSQYAATAAPAIDAWATANPIAGAYGTTWDRLLPLDAYRFDDAQPGEPADHLFPHRLISTSGEPDGQFIGRWNRSPLSDAALGSLGMHLVRELKMGQSPTGTDYLAIGFSGLDYTGHAFGPRSHEVQDTLLRLDVTIGALLDTLDTLVGRDRYVVAVTADHGVAPVPEQALTASSLAGRYTSTQVRTAIETALVPFFGEGPHITTISGANVYLTPGTLERVLTTPGARAAVQKAILAVPGVGTSYWADELASTTATDDPLLRLARASYVAEHSGDVMVNTAPNWLATTTVSTHGSPWDYDRKVPIIFAGAGIQPGTYLVPASPTDIAPTLAHLVGITLPQTDGRVLTNALSARP
jgi:predicted AlkP superfamily pyrophosphatase or phosphodiesterase